jgi:hypothetical protein
MQDYKHLAQKPKKERIRLIDILGAGCFCITMFLPFSREAWAFLIGALV